MTSDVLLHLITFNSFRLLPISFQNMIDAFGSHSKWATLRGLFLVVQRNQTVNTRIITVKHGARMLVRAKWNAVRKTRATIPFL